MSSIVIDRAIAIAALTVAFNWPADVTAAKADSAITVVAQLYKDFAWQALGGPVELFGADLTNQSMATLEKYFDPSLTTLLLRDAKCKVKSYEICRLDFDPIFASQDPSATDLEIALASAGHVAVKFNYPANNETIRLDFKVRQIAGKWKISDSVYQPPVRSLKNILIQDLP